MDDEDSLSKRLKAPTGREGRDFDSRLDIAIIRLPHISNFTDFNVLERWPDVGVRYVEQVGRLGKPDLVILPGTKNTMADLAWLRERGLEEAVLQLAEAGVFVIGICGGYQMLGEWLRDPWGVEGLPGECVRGMGLLQTETVFAVQKMRRQIRGSMSGESRMFGEGRGESFSGYEVCGYEIHMGDTIKTGEGTFVSAGEPSGRTVIRLEDGRCGGM